MSIQWSRYELTNCLYAWLTGRVHLPRIDGGFTVEANIDTWKELSGWLVLETTL